MEAFSRDHLDFVVTGVSGEHSYPVPARFSPDNSVTMRADPAFQALKHHRDQYGRDAMLDDRLEFRIPEDEPEPEYYEEGVIGWAGLNTVIQTNTNRFERTIPAEVRAQRGRSVAPAALYSFMQEVHSVAGTFRGNFLNLSPNNVGTLPPMRPPEYKVTFRHELKVPPQDICLPFYSGRIEVIPGHRIVVVDGQEIAVPPVPCKLISFLAQHPGTFYPSDIVLQHVWGYPPDTKSKALAMNISRLRSQLPPDAIRTSVGKGVTAARYAPDDPRLLAA